MVFILQCLGCANSTSVSRSARPADLAKSTFHADTLESPRTNVEHDTVVAYDELAQLLQRAAWSSDQYDAVQADDVRQLAADNSWLARQVHWEQGILRACPDEGEKPCHNETLRQMLAFREAHERNKAADEALESLYQLAQTQTALSTIEETFSSLDKVDARIVELRAAQIALPIDASAIDRQRAELLDQQTELRLAQLQLNVKLRSHIGSEGALPLWATDQWQFSASRLDLPAVLESAHRNRADLNGLQWLAHHADPEAIGALEKALGWTDPALGISRAVTGLSACLHRPSPDCCLFSNRREQVTELASAYSDIVSEQVQLAALTVEGRQRQVSIAAERVSSWLDRERILREKQQVNQASFFEVQEAEAKRIEAHGNFITAVIQWRASQAKLQAAEGRLGTEPLK
jgi:hypothetical protein